jgi:Nucleotidyl transferase AbiEii toxin, Type IV TA system
MRSVRFALVGGMAVSLRAEVRFTRDIDLAIDTATDAEVLVFALRDEGYRVKALVEREAPTSNRNGQTRESEWGCGRFAFREQWH